MFSNIYPHKGKDTLRELQQAHTLKISVMVNL